MHAVHITNKMLLQVCVMLLLFAICFSSKKVGLGLVSIKEHVECPKVCQVDLIFPTRKTSML